MSMSTNIGTNGEFCEKQRHYLNIDILVAIIWLLHMEEVGYNQIV